MNFDVNGPFGGTFTSLHSDADNEMIPARRKCSTRNKKSLLVTSHFTVLNFLYMADLLLVNDLCFVTEIKTINVQM